MIGMMGCLILKTGFCGFIGDANIRIEEDYLRILRLFRFAAVLPDFTIEKKSLNAARNKAHFLYHLSAERVRQELERWLSAKNRTQMLKVFALAGDIYHHLPSSLHDIYKNLNQLEALSELEKKYLTGNLTGNLAGKENFFLLQLTILSDQPQKLMKDLRLSRAQGRMLTQIVMPIGFSQANIFESLLYFGRIQSCYRLLYQYLKSAPKERPKDNELDKLIASIACYQPKEFPLKTADLFRENITADKKLGQTVMQTKSWWARGGFIADRQDCLDYALTLYHQDS